MLPLDLPGIAVTTTEAYGLIFAIHAGCEGRPVGCTTCGSTNFIGHGQHKQDVMDLPHHNRFTCIHLARKRYRCKELTSNVSIFADTRPRRLVSLRINQGLHKRVAVRSVLFEAPPRRLKCNRR